MRLACLCPTWGRRGLLLAESLGMFMSQTHEDKQLFVIDDMGNISVRAYLCCDNAHLLRMNGRALSMPSKYDWAVGEIMSGKYGPPPEGFVIWDDDDIYFPWHLEVHDWALGELPWSKPKSVWSTYTGTMGLEYTAGRFHASIAFRADAYRRVGGYKGTIAITETRRCDYDQRFMQALLLQFGLPNDTLDFNPEPSFCAAWGRAANCSSLSHGGDCELWYTRNRWDSRDTVYELQPIIRSPEEWHYIYKSVRPTAKDFVRKQ